MKFFYSASTMGYGEGRLWHKYFNFPKLPIVTKTLTWDSKIGIPFAVIPYMDSVWNRVGLHNMGFFEWFKKYFLNWSINFRKNIIVSIAGTDYQLQSMIDIFIEQNLEIGGIELNFSCPNIKSYNNKRIPLSIYPLYLKLNYKQDPYTYHNLDRIKSIRVNSVPKYFGGISGKAAQKNNWEYIKVFNNEGLNISGCSITSLDDIKILEDLDCKEVGIGSIILTNPRFIEKLGEDNE